MEEEGTEPQQLIPNGLPEFEGQQVVAVQTKINGSGQRITRPLTVGDTGVIIIEFEVKSVGHATTKDGLKRVQTLGVKDLFELEGKNGKSELSKAKLAHKKQDDERAKRLSLDGVDEHSTPGIEITIDENGVALTPSEIAAARGEEAEEEFETVTLIFDDNARAIWPDDFTDPFKFGTATPVAGDTIVRPADNKEVQIWQVLDSATGDLLTEWSDELENERLYALEKAAEQEEAGINAEDGIEVDDDE